MVHVVLLALLLTTPSLSAPTQTVITASTTSRHRAVDPIIAPWAYPRTGLTGDATVISSARWLRTTSTVTIDTRVNQPWWSAAFLGDYDVNGANTFPVRVWRYRGTTLCVVQTLLVRAEPGISDTFTVDVTQFRSGDVIMYESKPGYNVRTDFFESAVAAAPYFSFTVTSVAEQLEPRVLWPTPPDFTCADPAF